MPIYSTHGSFADALTNALTLSPSYPSGIVAGDVLYLHLAHGPGVGVCALPITGATEFTMISSASGGTGNTARQFIYRRVATSTESGTVTLSCTSTFTGVRWKAVIHKFSGLNTSTLEDSAAALATGNSTTATAPSVTALGRNRLGVVFGAWNLGADVISVPEFTGESGGDWLKRYDAFDELDSTLGTPLMFMHTATLSSSGTISGGISTSTTAGSGYILTGLSLIGSGGAPVFVGGTFQTAIFGGGIVTD